MYLSFCVLKEAITFHYSILWFSGFVCTVMQEQHSFSLSCRTCNELMED